MATPNYSYEKRQRELAKKKKQEDKRREKAERPKGGLTEGSPSVNPDDTPQSDSPQRAPE